MSLLWDVLGVLATLSGLVLAGSAAAVASLTWLDHARMDAADRIRDERLRAYREIMEAVVALNRTAVEMSDEEFHQEVDKYLMSRDSELKEPHVRVTQTYQRYYHVMGPEVYDAVNDYADYLATYHDEGAQIGELLTLGGKVGRAMRRDLGLDDLDRSPRAND